MRERRIAPLTDPIIIHTTEIMNQAKRLRLNSSASVMVLKIISMLYRKMIGWVTDHRKPSKAPVDSLANHSIYKLIASATKAISRIYLTSWRSASKYFAALLGNIL